MHWLILVMAIVFEVIGTAALKSSEGMTRLVPSVIMIISYGAAIFLLSLVLKTIPMGIGYGLWSGIGIVLITMVGWFFYQQPLDVAALVGIGFICVGVVIIQVFSQSVTH
jgi:small multidrug resistance pump